MSTQRPRTPHEISLRACLRLLHRAGRAGMNTRELAKAVGVSEHHITHTMDRARKAGQVHLQKRWRAPSMWYATGVEPEDRESALGTGKPLTVKTRERLVLDHAQPTVVPPGVKVTRCPTRWA